MADPWHHAVSSAKHNGGEPEDYLPIHNWFDETKKHFADPRHRALRHHSEGIGLMISIFGPTIAISACSTCGNPKDHPRHEGVREGTVTDIRGPNFHLFQAKVVPTRWIGEQHVLEDFGRIPTAADFLREMAVQPWMVKGARKLSREIERDESLTRQDRLARDVLTAAVDLGRKPKGVT